MSTNNSRTEILTSKGRTMTKAHIRAELEGRLHRLISRDAAVSKHLRGKDGRLNVDASDRAAIVQMDEVLEQLDVQGRKEILEVRDALVALQNGTYGQCRRCKKLIGQARLGALLAAPFCVDCAD